MSQGRKKIVILIVMLLCVGCDQASKAIATHVLFDGREVKVLGDMVRLQYSENTGAMMGIGGNLPEETRFWLFTVLTGAALVGIMAYLVKGKGLRPIDIAAFSLIAGGGASNLADRLLKGGVVIDFILVTIGDFRTNIFNIADALVVCGLLLLGLANMPWFVSPSGESDRH